ncbi:hypothetical protein PsorP6_003308 [Peronosclerospora sorghi]|uniref:Uncharacterized protein n=1 Tax=Peronosclerospora sorghi TaxID=230839 RepID=A0ACC0VKN8_9STRA|nr:hypothetical protein PsorP6_003308 [Peronosclerospora sorghi]
MYGSTRTTNRITLIRVKRRRGACRNLSITFRTTNQTLAAIIRTLSSFSRATRTDSADSVETVYGSGAVPLSIGKKLQEHKTPVYLINTGWTGGVYGVVKRMKMPFTRKCVDAALDGSITEASKGRAVGYFKPKGCMVGQSGIRLDRTQASEIVQGELQAVYYTLE